MTYIRLVQGLAVDVDLPVENSDMVPRQANYALHKMLTRLRLVIRGGKFEDHHITPAQVSRGQQAREESRLGGKNELVDQQVVANQKRVFHRPGGDFKGLEDEGRSENGQNDRNHQGLKGVSSR